MHFVDFMRVKVSQFGFFCISFQISPAEVGNCPHYGGLEIQLTTLLYIYLEQSPHSEDFAA
jgi:hypothetical protein